MSDLPKVTQLVNCRVKVPSPSLPAAASDIFLHPPDFSEAWCRRSSCLFSELTFPFVFELKEHSVLTAPRAVRKINTMKQDSELLGR